MSDKGQKSSLENFLTPEVLRANWITASIYIAAFELLKTAIVKRIYGFYTIHGTTEAQQITLSIRQRFSLGINALSMRRSNG